MNSKFFTNRDNNTLQNRLIDILKHHNIKYLEFLIGYFRISGFIKIAKLLKDIEKARILVGINVDRWIYEAKERGKEANIFDNLQIIDRFIQEQLNGQIEKNSIGVIEYEGLNSEPYEKEIEESINLLASYLANKKLEIRISPNKNIHSKIYILRQKEIIRHDGTIEYIGSVITGSSNLTANGLQSNFEFNVELKDSDDIAFALKEFENLWSSAVELKEDDIQEIKNRSYLKEITPYELYIKFLIEHFEDRIEYDPSFASTLPKGYMKLAYQIDAVNEGISKIKKHNGFFLSDVVGLGKTVTTAMIVKKLLFEIKGEVLVIAPPSIQKEWKETFKRFDIGSFRHYDIISIGKLEQIQDTQNYELIIIDESHKFKNYDTSRYKELERICKERVKYQKKVILISATPLNNRPMDIANQLYLFQDKRNSTIPSYPNLESFFGDISRQYKEILKEGTKLTIEQKRKLKELAQKIRDNILREVMVRRTRLDILTHPMYAKDLQKQGLNIPIVEPVKEIEYKMSDSLTKAFDETVTILTQKLQYERYKLLYYLKPEARAKFGKVSENIFEKGALQLASLMQLLLVKRFESSFYAFKSSLYRQKRNLEKLIAMFEEGRILIGSKIDIYDLLDLEDVDEKIDTMLESGKIKEFNPDDFEKEYLPKLKEELKIFTRLIKLWQDLNDDPKLEQFKQVLKEQKDKKIVVFTESKETACYLERELKNFKILCIHGGNREKLKEIIRENFDANFDIKKQKNDFNIIITTDTLSESVNLHRSNIIYNYDIPWNSTKLMQRIGRINRIGTKFDKIYIYNFIPTAKSDALIELSKKAFVKLQTFHSTFGEDSQIYSTEEEVGSVKLFEETIDEVDEELKYLEEIREFKKAYPKKFEIIKNYPPKIRVQREKEPKNTSFVFIKNNNSKSYFLVDSKLCKAVNFLEMAKQLKTSQKTKSILPISSIHYEHVKKAIDFYKESINKIITTTNWTKISNATDKKALRLLKSWRDKGYIDINRYKQFKELLETGRYQNLSKEIKKLEKENVSNISNKIEELILKYNLDNTQNKNDKKISLNAKIILSETFV
ncbi:helicase-related protein [Nitratiruptor tergarcus]|uniref:Superfamily II DNA and RNA helicases n=1 Tax=Nitratiruptor tergarcus DSM 16512 TaxID=1069081 RepID=A0A1W1WR61_9BACT|nr:helicase-related protein [Nitratiruptor tergarcus]SMC08794.1 Superfamily II DNA and RNA helicases [Nitratiruptor tergarcus DSM 16512]